MASRHDGERIATLVRLNRSIVETERLRDEILTKKDAYPASSEKAKQLAKKLNVVQQDLFSLRREREEAFRAEDYGLEKVPYMAAYHGSLPALKEFVSTMSPITSNYLEYVDPETGNTPLLAACARGNVECAKLLIAVGANTDAHNKTGSSALHCACAKGQVEIVTLLLAVPFLDPYVRDNRDQSALHVARLACLENGAWVRYKECARLLEERCSVFRGWAYERVDAPGLGKLFSSPWKLRYVVILRTNASSQQLEMSLFKAAEYSRCPPVPTSTLLYTLGNPIQRDVRGSKKELAFSFPAQRDASSAPMTTIQFAAATPEGLTAWLSFFKVYSKLKSIDDVLLLRDEEEKKPPKQVPDWNNLSSPSNQMPPSPSAPRLSLPPSSPPPDAPSAPSLALSPSAQVAFEVGHDAFDGLNKGKAMKKTSTSDDSTLSKPAMFVKKSAASSARSEQLEEKDERRRDCIVCFDAAQDAVCVPCGHNAICMDCAELLMQQDVRPCPVCRKNIREVVRIYHG
ncbi:unnamed protein product [Aphanomyces euteiches]|uniref:RING-type domain-containing protein n=1 Tax=Aphanomyces euteiches TaxID=100861 RepID=A0A6G0XC78_9STRA|nr:hypothetical protein Ae201684_006301 [Aphanomyces euteiches]KAH9091007.1 hypothetical protein Ae201684P_006408 [Aphanomyces euteiches]KAH9119463.1 hypothetical protein AeMF1_007854 [Aphanomyces euteiches]KAH9135262.1 hypothetical protein LEN26_006499 [Aphanomyces euteiches]KAH9135643.1 hypothetical protein AeRB84_018979 [Aphanomyces euteiches]